jgi:hypothetical protein
MGRVDVPQSRREVMDNNGCNLRELYRTLELPGSNSLKALPTTPSMTPSGMPMHGT